MGTVAVRSHLLVLPGIGDSLDVLHLLGRLLSGFWGESTGFSLLHWLSYFLGNFLA